MRPYRATCTLRSAPRAAVCGRRLPGLIVTIAVVLLTLGVAFAQTDQENVDALWKKAEGQLGQGDREGALATAKAAAEAAPQEPDAWWLLSFVHGQRGEYSQAEAACREGLRLAPEHAGLYNDLGLALVYQGRLEDGVEAFRCSVKYSEEGAALVLAHSNLGWALLRSGSLDEAIAELSEAIRLQPEHALSHQRLAQALWTKGSREEAVLEYRRAVMLNPSSATARTGLGRALHHLGRSKEAIEEFRAAVSLNPRLAEAHYELGLALRDDGQTDAAVDEYKAALALNAEHAEAHSSLASVLAARGSLDEAISHYQDAIRLNPELIAAHDGLGQALAAQGKLEQAAAVLEKAIVMSADPRTAAYARNSLGRVYLQMGRPQEAMVAYQAALDEPAYDTPELALANIAEVLVSLGRHDEAVAKYEEALGRKPDNGVIHYQFGNALWAKGDTERAAAEFGKAIGLDTDPVFTAYAHNNLGLILLGQDKLDEAIQEFQQALGSPAYDTPELALANIADAQERKGDLEAAVKSRRELVRLRPQDGRAHCLLAGILLRLGSTDEAEAEYRRTILLASDPWATANAHYGLGMVLQRQGRPVEAVVEHKAALASPDFTTPALAHLGMGRALEDQGLLEEAIAEYREAVRLDPDRAAARNNLGAALKRRGLLDEAVQELQAAIALDNDPVSCSYARYNLGDAYYLAGKLEEAVSAYREAMDSSAFDVPELARAAIAEALVAAGRVEEAIAEYREAVQLAPETVDLRLGLSRAYAYAGSRQEARAGLEAVAAAAPDNPDVLFAQAAMAIILDEMAQAEVPLSRAMRLPQVPARTRAALAYFLAAKGNPDGARTQLDALAEALRAPEADGDADLLYFAAMAQRQIGDTAAAAKTAARITGRWPRHPLAPALSGG